MTKYKTNDSGNLIGYFGFFEIEQLGWVYFLTGYEHDCADDQGDDSVYAELLRIFNPIFKDNFFVALGESEHGIRVKENEKLEVVKTVEKTLKSLGWILFEEL